MTPEHRQKLNELAYNNAILHTLLQHYDHGGLSFEDWAVLAIGHLTEANNLAYKVALDAEMRAGPRPLIMPKPTP